MGRKRPPAAGGLRAGFRLWISSGEVEGVFGDGKWRLLQAIDRHGSLKAATDALGISYRKAWGDLRKAESALGVRFLERTRGGRDGGETRLTEVGRRWVAAYARMRTRLDRAVEREFLEMTRRINE